MGDGAFPDCPRIPGPQQLSSLRPLEKNSGRRCLVVGGAWPELEGEGRGLGKMGLDWPVRPLSVSLTPKRGSGEEAVGP